MERIFPQGVAPLAKALVTGNRTDLSDSFNTDLQRTGLTHTVAVSGSHLVLLAGLLSLLLGGSRRGTALVLIPVSILFTMMTGCTPSIVRAAIMIILLQIAPLLAGSGTAPPPWGRPCCSFCWQTPSPSPMWGSSCPSRRWRASFCAPDASRRP